VKKPLYYAIRTGSLYNPVIAVTTEKGHRWHGREVKGDMPTHGVLSDLSGRFDDVESAVAMRDSIAKLADSYDAVRRALQKENSRLYAMERRAMERLLAGQEPGPVPVVAAPVRKTWIASSNCEWTSQGRRSLYGRAAMNDTGDAAHMQLEGACARAAEDINPKAGGFIVVLPKPEESY
jgi:hypothetical protein